MSDDTEVNVKGLENLLKALKGKPPQARVGILGSKAARTDGSLTNADIGAVHEFGSPARKIPPRSFLRVPISENLGPRLNESGAFDEDVLKEVIKAGTVIPWLTKIAILAEGIVADAFDTGGFGKWAPWKSDKYMNNAGQILVDTQQLRNSITSEVK